MGVALAAEELDVPVPRVVDAAEETGAELADHTLLTQEALLVLMDGEIELLCSDGAGADEANPASNTAQMMEERNRLIVWW